MQITEFSGKNLLGLPTVRLECGMWVEVRGANASGKTSVLESIKAALVGGSLARIKNVYTDDSPEATVVFDDGRFRLERVGDKVKLFERIEGTAEESVKRPQSELDKWFDRDLADVVKFLTAPQKERLDLFLRAVPFDLQPEAVRDALGDDVYSIVQRTAEKGGHPLTLLAAVHEEIYAARRGINVSADQKRKHARELKRSIPPTTEDANDDAIAALDGEHTDLAAQLLRVRERAESAYKMTVGQADADFKAWEAKRRYKLEQDIANLRAEADGDITNERSAVALVVKAAEGARAEALRAGAPGQELLDKVTQRLASARADRDTALKTKTLRDVAEKAEKDADDLEGKADAYTAGLDAITALKARLLSAIPIDGLEVTDKDILVNKVPFDQVNTANRVRLAAQVAILRASKYPLKVAFIDNAEALEPDNLDLLRDLLEEANIQCFVAVRTSGPLEVVG